MATDRAISDSKYGSGLVTDGLPLLPEQIDFLNEVEAGAQGITEGGLVSIILFGSVVKGGAVKGVSDFDMVLVVKDGLSPAKIMELRSYLCSVCSSHGIADLDSLEFEGIPKFVMRETGMFVSHIICRERDFLSQDFSKVFDTNPLISRIIVPSTIVMGSVLRESRTVFGKDLVSSLTLPQSSKLEILKSMFMNELLVLLSLLYFFTYNSTKLAMEATKWSVYNVSYIITGESRPLAASIDLLSGFGLRLRHLEHLLSLRRQYRHDVGFAFLALGFIARVHLFLIDEWDRLVDMPHELPRSPSS